MSERIDLTGHLPSDLGEICLRITYLHDDRVRARVREHGCRGEFLMPEAIIVIRGEPADVRAAISAIGADPGVWAVSLATEAERARIDGPGWQPAPGLDLDAPEVTP